MAGPVRRHRMVPEGWQPVSDLPEVIEISRDTWLAAQKKARVYKEGPTWTWDHWCAWKNHDTYGYPHETQALAFVFAMDHMKRCVG